MDTISYVEYPIYSIATNGELVATSGGGGGSDYGIEDQLETHRVNLETGQLLPVTSTAEAGGVVDSLCYNKNVDLWCGCCQGQVVLIKQDEDQGLSIVARFGPPPPPGGKRARVITARFSPSGEIVVAGGEDKVIRVWRIARAGEQGATLAPDQAKEKKGGKVEQWSGTLVCELRGHEGDIKDCCISSDNSLVASCGADSKLCLWDWRTGALLHTVEKQNPKKPQEKLTFRCGRSIAYGGSAGSSSRPPVDKKSDDNAPADMQNVSSPSAVSVTQLCESLCDDNVPCCQAEISADGQLIAVGFADGKCKVYNRGLSLVAQSSKHDLPVTGLCFLNGDRTLVSTSADYSLVTMDLTRRRGGACSRCCCCRKRTCFCGFCVLLFLLLAGALVLHHVASLGFLHFVSKHEAAQMGKYRETTEDLLLAQRLHDLELEQREEERQRLHVAEERSRAHGTPRSERKTRKSQRQTGGRRPEQRQQAKRGASVKDEL
ncbi:WD domain, G-beta repeat-containing protein [Besnoitia besnoiti]|uniref:WD domain, G-beta repeat-containing protein n=1 Tax=Besnoitia besnoiti TaxID=94643 RepID=A0A2A9M804_BESBE|nr:WD domain, G-beta repeat-containing protein [Besnoitia besnoiti]PFH32421.1 WD domain, G-beta repeat-containing protein [Besnoitia besnoiti]